MATNPTQKARGFIGEFRAFIARGNVLDLAVGVIIGGAFSAITTSLVNDIVNPILGIFTGGGEALAARRRCADAGQFYQRRFELSHYGLCGVLHCKGL